MSKVNANTTEKRTRVLWALRVACWLLRLLWLLLELADRIAQS